MRFHDSSPLTAANVAFSLDRARAKGSGRAIDFASVAAATTIDNDTIEIATKRPDLLLPVRLRRLFILPKAWADRQGAVLPARSDDRAAYTVAHENGTGPFMLESFEPGKRTVLVRSPVWWGASQWPNNLDRIVWTLEPDPERRLAMLLEGEADLLQDLPLDRLDRLRGVPGVRLAQMSALATAFLGLNQGSAELRSSDVRGRNPFADLRVRRAVYQAIDVQALIANALGGNAVPAGMIAAPGVNGYDPELDQRFPYDPERARALLAEAGYPEGFAVRLDCPEYRREVCQELAAQLAAVGLRLIPDVQPFSVYKQRIATRATD